MENTVLILGAGFSKPYGYPTGPELVKGIIGNHNNSSNPTFKNIAQDLSEGGFYSIDKFLSEYPRHYDIGVRLILEAIHNAEGASLGRSVTDEEDIIKYLLDQVTEANFEKIRIISFNYDRYFELRFLKKLKSKHGSIETANELFKRIKIEHIHGRMPSLDGFELSSEKFAYKYGCEGEDGNYENKVKQVLLENVSKEFKTIYSNSKEPNQFAISSIKWAKRVFFLGFAYDDLNMMKMGFNIPGLIYDWSSKCIAGTSYGIKSVKKNEIESTYPFLKGRLFAVNCREFFAEHFDLNNSNHDNVKTNLKSRTCCEIHAIQERPQNNSNYFHEKMVCNECDKLITVTYSRTNPHLSETISIQEHPEYERNWVTHQFPRKVFR